MDSKTAARLKTDPDGFIERAIRKYVRTSPLNHLASFDNAPIFERPLIGFADGDDSIFTDYKIIIGPEHFTPREMLTRYLTETLNIKSPKLDCIRVISFSLPILEETRQSNARETKGPSLRWNHTRWKGQEFINDLSNYVAKRLQDAGYYAVAPESTVFFKSTREAPVFTSNWSQRHTAYAAGLGTFSLTDALITPKGIAHRLGSVVTNLELTPTPRIYAHRLANCKFYDNKSCTACMARCPYGALTEKGHDKSICYQVLNKTQKPWLEGKHGPGYIGSTSGCGLCQTGVPCEHRIPVSKKKRLLKTA